MEHIRIGKMLEAIVRNASMVIHFENDYINLKTFHNLSLILYNKLTEHQQTCSLFKNIS